MKKKTGKTVSDEDIALFRQAVRGTRRLHHDKVDDHRPAPSPRRPVQPPEPQAGFRDMLSDEMEVNPVEAADELLFQRPGLQTTVMKKLRRGQFPGEAELDLHGMRIDDARAAVANFLDRALELGMRCVRIVHGKGHGSHQRAPVLKNKVNSWLRQREEVLAFSSARPADGGTGAVYVLLKRH